MGDGRDRSKVTRATEGFRWRGVEVRRYKDPEEGAFRGVSRQELLGAADDEGALSFQTRYFEVDPGGWTSLERHGHPHAVVVVRGRGRVELAGEVHELGPLDCVYVAPDDVHRFHASVDAALGFLCVVDRDRDRPRPVEEGAGRSTR